MKRLATTVGLSLLAGCGSAEPTDFYLNCTIPEQGTFPAVTIHLQLKPSAGKMLELRDGSFQDVCFGNGFECGAVTISDGLIMQTITYPGPDGGQTRRQDR